MLKLNPSERVLFVLGVLTLCLELALIRWCAAYVVFLQFFSNIVLVASFLGLALGSLNARSARDWFTQLPRAVTAILGFGVIVFLLFARWSNVALNVSGGESGAPVFFGTERHARDLATFSIPIEIIVACTFLLVCFAFLGIGQRVGEELARAPDRVRGYCANLLGSAFGILLFSLCSLGQSPPLLWFAMIILMYVWLRRQQARLQSFQLAHFAATLTIAAVTSFSFVPNQSIHWSPYYAVRYNGDALGINVNSLAHQVMRPRASSAHDYSLVHLLRARSGGAPFQRVLIIGAGSGNDVAHALVQGAKAIDAVEIDPMIQHLGQDFHPDRPYSDSRVRTTVTDGRHFLKTTSQKYDLVVYALVDSLLLASSYGNIRLESFLFTREAFEDVRRVLDDGGVFVMYNYFRQAWVVARIKKMLEEAFGQEALLLTIPEQRELHIDASVEGASSVLLVGATRAIVQSFEERDRFWVHPDLALSVAASSFGTDPPTTDGSWIGLARTLLAGNTTALGVATDDWPYLYVRTPSISFRPYLTTILLMLGCAGVLLRRVTHAPCQSRSAMFWLGFGFLLLETSAVARLALLLGSTWVVNSAVFFSILVILILSNLTVLMVRPSRLTLVFCALISVLAILCLVPFQWFLDAGVIARLLVPSFLLLLPIFFSGIIFSSVLATEREPGVALGWNILGSVAGACAEYLTMVVGFRGLLVVAMVAYGLAYLAMRRRVVACA